MPVAELIDWRAHLPRRGRLRRGAWPSARATARAATGCRSSSDGRPRLAAASSATPPRARAHLGYARRRSRGSPRAAGRDAVHQHHAALPAAHPARAGAPGGAEQPVRAALRADGGRQRLRAEPFRLEGKVKNRNGKLDKRANDRSRSAGRAGAAPATARSPASGRGTPCSACWCARSRSTASSCCASCAGPSTARTATSCR
jgi:hypothetical protein